MAKWQPIETAPKDKVILVRRHNGVSHEYAVVWWAGDDPTYPWMADFNSYAADRFDDWLPIPGERHG